MTARWSVRALVTVLLLAAVLPARAPAEELAFRLTAIVEAETSAIDVTPTLALPDPQGTAGWRTRQSSAVAVLRPELSFGALAFYGQVRLLARDTGPATGPVARGATVELDELYGEARLSDATFVYLGRRNLSFGQSFGINPSDVFFDRLDINRRLGSDRQRSETRAIDMVGFQHLTPGGSSITGFYAPTSGALNRGEEKDRWLLSYRTRFGARMNDLAVNAFGGDRPGASLSVVLQTEGDWLVYTDTALRRGRAVRTVGPTDAAGGFAVLPREADRWVAEATVGVGYTFANGLSANLEYTHLGGGLTGDEQARLLDAGQANTPPGSAVEAARLGTLRGLSALAELRRNYLFVRLFQERVARTKLQAQVTALHGLDDGSGSLGARFEYPFTPETSLWFYVNHRYGGDLSEFRQRTDRGTVSLGLTQRF